MWCDLDTRSQEESVTPTYTRTRLRSARSSSCPLCESLVSNGRGGGGGATYFPPCSSCGGGHSSTSGAPFRMRSKLRRVRATPRSTPLTRDHSDGGLAPPLVAATGSCARGEPPSSPPLVSRSRRGPPKLRARVASRFGGGGGQSGGGGARGGGGGEGGGSGEGTSRLKRWTRRRFCASRSEAQLSISSRSYTVAPCIAWMSASLEAPRLSRQGRKVRGRLCTAIQESTSGGGDEGGGGGSEGGGGDGGGGDGEGGAGGGGKGGGGKGGGGLGGGGDGGGALGGGGGKGGGDEGGGGDGEGGGGEGEGGGGAGGGGEGGGGSGGGGNGGGGKGNGGGGEGDGGNGGGGDGDGGNGDGGRGEGGGEGGADGGALGGDVGNKASRANTYASDRESAPAMTRG